MVARGRRGVLVVLAVEVQRADVLGQVPPPPGVVGEAGDAAHEVGAEMVDIDLFQHPWGGAAAGKPHRVLLTETAQCGGVSPKTGRATAGNHHGVSA